MAVIPSQRIFVVILSISACIFARVKQVTVSSGVSPSEIEGKAAFFCLISVVTNYYYWKSVNSFNSQGCQETYHRTLRTEKSKTRSVNHKVQ